ncbi:hypothetical protein [Nocardia sp. NPDC050710]|uniref:hypothetical protein n=1 Tax=Nocardia sp. NPDC050710 TaxID=3157220 RepID=UPI00340D7AD3
MRLPAAMLTVVDEYSRAVLAGDTTADAVYAAALNGPVGSWPLDRARLQLHHGRRLRRMSEAGGPLRAAHDSFDALGADPWAEAARNELRAAGETSTRRTPTARDQLTSQELHSRPSPPKASAIARSPKSSICHIAPSAHLYRIYPRPGITSRVEIAAALEGISAA